MMRFGRFGYVLLLCAASLWCAACGGGSETAGDASSPGDTLEEAVAPGEVLADQAGDQARTPDDLPAPGCETPDQGVLLPPDSGSRRFALSLFHYNLQYVAGGLKGFMDRPQMDLSDEEVQDRIIVESFFPMLDVLEAHPTWGMDAEMQGMMVEAIRERHPDALPRIRALVERGQLHVDSFHYSDQLWVAYPLPSMERSFAFNQRAFADACLPLGGAVFTQEGQFGHGMAHHIRTSERVALYPTNLFKYYSGNDPGALLYEWGGTPVVIAGKGVTEEVGGEPVEVTWHFMNDGELAFTGNANPYFGTLFRYDAKETKKYVEKLEQMEAEGWQIATVADYVAHLRQMGYAPKPMPLALDGAWQPKDTQNVYRWMGQVGEVGGPVEDDNGVLTGNVRSRILLQAAEAAAALAGIPEDESAPLLDQGWYHQLLAEVSDSTGWNPWLGEILYSKNHSAEAAQAAWTLATMALEQAGGSMLLDTATGMAVADESTDPAYRISAADSVVLEALTENGDEPLDVTVEAPGWTTSLTWRMLPGEKRWELRVEGTPDPAAGEDEGRVVSVRFPRFGNTLRYVPALMEDEGTVTAFDVTSFALDQTQYLALGLANGLLDLGGDRWLIKAASTVHVAAVIPKETEQVRFENRTQPVGEPFTWVFYYLEGAPAEAAVALADRVNVHPVVRLENGR